MGFRKIGGRFNLMASHLSPDSVVSVQSSLGNLMKNSKISSSYGLEDEIDITSGPSNQPHYEMTFEKS